MHHASSFAFCPKDGLQKPMPYLRTIRNKSRLIGKSMIFLIVSVTAFHLPTEPRRRSRFSAKTGLNLATSTR
jgi:hypothetical protein